MRDLKEVAPYLALIALPIAIAACPPRSSPPAEQPPPTVATPRPTPYPTPRPRFTSEHILIERNTLNNIYIRVICDTATGHLLYLYGAGAPGAGIAVVPGGCARVELRCTTPEATSATSLDRLRENIRHLEKSVEALEEVELRCTTPERHPAEQQLR